jgi:glutamate mutase epsilon subunit
MSFNLKELHISKHVPIFIRAKKILESNNDLDFEEVIAVQEELEEYEAQIRELRHEIFRVTQNDMIKIFVRSFEEDIEQKPSS